MLDLEVHEQLKFIAPKALLTLYVEVKAVPAVCQDYNISVEDETSNPMSDHAVGMPSYGHTFHHKCITKWFD